MEKSLKNKVDELTTMIKSLDCVSNLSSLSSIILDKYETIDEMKKEKDSYLITSFKNNLEEANELSLLINDIFKRELQI